MWEGGFYTRQQTGLSLDAPEYDAYYSLLESAGLPILYHVNAQYRPEIDGLLPKHPNLKIIFAHFYGGSRDLQRLRRFLDKWPNIYVDLAPGSIFRGLSDNRDEARELFIEHQDRILFGTDASASTPQSVERSKLLVRFLRRILERKDNLDLAEIGVFEPEENDPTITEQQRLSRQEFWAEHGLYLDDEVLERIYAGNFARVVGSDPKKANARIALTECERLLERVSQEVDDYWDPEGRGSHRTDHLGELEQIAAILRTIVQ
jgi:predicted TIM-barrel fold metal-dependent hydrolase